MNFLNPFRSLEDDRRMHQRRAAVAFMDKKPWAEVKPPKRRYEDVGIIASTWDPENPLAEIFPKVPKDGITYKDRLRYILKPLPLFAGLPISGAEDLYHDPGRAYFDAAVRIPAFHFKLGPKEKPWQAERWDVWMSLTPMEMWTQRSGIQAATGRVILGGLGMGWLLWQIAKKSTVKEIVVVEKGPDILEWFGNRVCERTPKVSAVICGDYFECAHKFDLKKDRFLADIWPEHGDAQMDRNLARLRATGAKVWAWGSVRPDDYHRQMIDDEKNNISAGERAAMKGLGE